MHDEQVSEANVANVYTRSNNTTFTKRVRARGQTIPGTGRWVGEPSSLLAYLFGNAAISWTAVQNYRRRRRRRRCRHHRELQQQQQQQQLYNNDNYNLATAIADEVEVKDFLRCSSSLSFLPVRKCLGRWLASLLAGWLTGRCLLYQNCNGKSKSWGAVGGPGDWFSFVSLYAVFCNEQQQGWVEGKSRNKLNYFSFWEGSSESGLGRRDVTISMHSLRNLESV
ncbi:unnamed protein product [Ceratitis capitata]|uniref:(Mediterranean fruit fly) hypothetical protein n=1 Tax=Ceratitis capitata TaxID=7213 RepID=A0A811UZX4_CERCA|nr:unnamed protein product [Ceratitis capitata]